jgi:hypothetical protein
MLVSQYGLSIEHEQQQREEVQERLKRLGVSRDLSCESTMA